ncbi:glutathione S-transferase family protein [Hahella sp. HN01]|uniref:glutathione S-transferase family protein n=1 Tax=Hahella sp. HN01 TaxID=2847262 RepID=UPI001C1EBC30|nr:glutathione S-transferase family protein [Hahella sp. HN01]MBU6953418.1 glutathione S-transferase family protein [Hahella sp. HN01]
MSAQVHIFGPQFSTFVRTVMLCCEEKGVSYSHGFSINGEEVEYKGERHLNINPFGKVPVLIHGDRKLYETASICRYLDAQFEGPALQPEDLYQRALVDQWSAAISLYVDQAIVREYLTELAFPKGENGEVRWNKVSEAQPNVIKMLQILAAQLGDAAFICGEQYTIADALITPMLDYLSNLPQAAELIAPDSTLSAYVGRMRQRPAAKTVLTAMAR